MNKDDIEASEDAVDLAVVTEFHRRLARGEEELVPAAIVDRLLGGESRIRAWREYRGLEAATLADSAGIPLATLLRIEAQEESASPSDGLSIADVLNLMPGDLY